MEGKKEGRKEGRDILVYIYIYLKEGRNEGI
jgi:hypothetical protein